VRRAEAGDVCLQVERHVRRLVDLEKIGRHLPHHLELDPVEILALQTAADAVVVLTDERAHLSQAILRGVEVGQRGYLPGVVVQPDLPR
jgi:hypothetical protein